jgi:hypothetical protein
VTWRYGCTSAYNILKKARLLLYTKKAFQVVKSNQELAVIGPQYPNFLKEIIREEVLGEHVEQDSNVLILHVTTELCNV